jgi:hypothetical protein
MNISDAFDAKKYRRWMLGVTALAAGLRLAVAWQPISVLITKNLPDDAYYYFVIAHNTVRHGSVSLDGIHTTNGFHPLWWLILLPVFGTTHALTNFQVTVALTLAGLLDLVTLWLLGRLALRLTGRHDLAILAAGLYAANPIVILQVTNGLETSTAMLTIALFLLLLTRWQTEPDRARFEIWTGLAGGAMFLARTDTLFVLGLAYLVLLWFWRARRDRLLRVITAGGITLSVCLPWFIWGQVAVGSWLQDSGLAVPYAARERLAMQGGLDLAGQLKASLAHIFYVPNLLRGDFSGLPLFIGLILWVVVGVGLVFRWRNARDPRELVLLVPLVGSGLALILAHAGVRWYPRPWYFLPSSLAFALTFIVVFQDYLGGLPRRLFLTAVSFAVYFVISGYIFWQIGYYPWQSEMLAASRWMAAHIPASAKVGSFNSGIYAYYNDFQVINLDGVVNHEAFDAIQHKRMLGYMKDSGIDYLVDSDNAIRNEYAPFMGQGFPGDLTVVATLSQRELGDFGYLRVYRVDR